MITNSIGPNTISSRLAKCWILKCGCRELELGDQAKYTCRVTNPLEQTESHLQLIVSGMGPEIMNTFR